MKTKRIKLDDWFILVIILVVIDQAYFNVLANGISGTALFLLGILVALKLVNRDLKKAS